MGSNSKVLDMAVRGSLFVGGVRLLAEAFPDTFPLRRDFDVKRFKEDIGELPDF